MGLSKIRTTVSRYNYDTDGRGPESYMTPAEWQSIAEHVDASKPWAVAVRADPDEAERDAKALFVSLYGAAEKVAHLAKIRQSRRADAREFAKPKNAAPPKAKPKAAPPPVEDDDDVDGMI